MWRLFRRTLNFQNSFKSAFLLALAIFSISQSAYADVCVWRDPERTMQRIFPEAADYKTVTVKMTPERIVSIEKALGSKLDDSERHTFDFYDITGAVGGKSQKLGTVLALAGKGEYGTIEVVIGVNEGGKIVGAYVQRSRERSSHAIKSPEFLKQFVGKTKDEGFEVSKDIQSANPEAEAASRVIAFVVKKMLVFYDALTKVDNQP